MQLNLERIDASGLDLTFGGAGAREHHITLGAVNALCGALSHSDNSIRLSEVAFESAIVTLLQLKFESFSVALHAEGSLSELTGSYARQEGSTTLNAIACALHAPELQLDFEEFQVRGALRGENVVLHISGSEGRVQADSLELGGLQFAGSLGLTGERLLAKSVDVSWGPAGYAVRVGEIQISRSSAELELSRSAGAAGGQPKPRLVDWNVLDGLSGSLDVDLFVDVTVPVIGSRRATHPFRIFIESGSLNYRDLERNLSALEDAFLDFAVRQGALVLERGIPLLPTRGHGKPIFSWPLSTGDLELANDNRVRLAALPLGHPVEHEEPSKGESKGSDVALRQLSFVDVQTLLRLAPTQGERTPVRNLSFEELQVHGTVHHRAEGEPPSGELMGQLRGLQGKVAALALGTSTLDLGALRIGHVGRLQIPFRGVQPQKVSCEVADLSVSALCLGNRRS